MRVDFQSGNYLEIEIGRGTAGIPFDCAITVAMRCAPFEGRISTYADGPDVEVFMRDLSLLSQTLRGEASLVSDDGRGLELNFRTLDSLGHLVAEVQMQERFILRSREFALVCSGVFEFEAQAFGEFCNALVACIHEGTNA